MPLVDALSVLVVGGVRRLTCAVEGYLPPVDRGGVVERGPERLSHVVDVDPVEVARDPVEVLEGRLEQRPHPRVVLEVDALVRARGHLDHPVEEGALGRAAAVVVPLVLEAVVALVVGAVVEKPHAVFGRASERRVFPVPADRLCVWQPVRVAG